MVKSICVQPPLLARLATVSVLQQRAVNRQPGFRSETRRAGVFPMKINTKTVGKRRSRDQRTQVHLTMTNLRLKMFSKQMYHVNQ